MFRVDVLCDNPGCDRGGRQSGWTDREPWQFIDEATALAGVLELGWRQWPDGRLLCDRCSLREDCAQRGGHTYGPWLSPSGAWCNHCWGAFQTPDAVAPAH